MDYNSYLAELNFKKDKLLLRIKQSSDIKKEILKHIKENKEKFIKFMENLNHLESTGDLYHLENHYTNLDIIDCQMSILDDEAGDIVKMVSFSKYYQSLDDNDRDDIIKAL